MKLSLSLIEFFLTAYPDVEIREIDEDWEFTVLACDGIWDVLSNSVSNGFH
jgi:protein phosphatase PTC2/3